MKTENGEVKLINP